MDSQGIKQEVSDNLNDPIPIDIDCSNSIVKQEEILPDKDTETDLEPGEIRLQDISYNPYIHEHDQGVQMSEPSQTNQESTPPITIVPLSETFSLTSSLLFNCAHCDLSFNTKPLLQAHIINHIAPNARTNVIMYLCVQCHKGFLIKPDFESHINLHKKEKIYYHNFTQIQNNGVVRANKEQQSHKCRICGEKLASVKALHNHCKTVHAGPPFYKCDICEQRFVLKSNYDKHLEYHDPRLLRLL